MSSTSGGLFHTLHFFTIHYIQYTTHCINTVQYITMVHYFIIPYILLHTVHYIILYSTIQWYIMPLLRKYCTLHYLLCKYCMVHYNSTLLFLFYWCNYFTVLCTKQYALFTVKYITIHYSTLLHYSTQEHYCNDR